MYIFRHRERLCLLLLGIFFVSLAAGVAAATARSAQGTVDEELAQHWRTDYDLLVRPSQAVNPIEKETESISGRFQSNTFARRKIELSHLNTIRSIEGVEVAAPLATVGPASLTYGVGVPLKYDDLNPGIYKETILVTEHNGIEDIPVTYTRYLVIHPRDTNDPVSTYPLDFYSAGLNFSPFVFTPSQFFINVVAVDFEAEAALHGLDKAVLEGSFPPSGKTYNVAHTHEDLPMLISNAYRPQGMAKVSIFRLSDLELTVDTIETLAWTEENILVQSREEHIKDFDLDLSAPLVLPDLGERFAMSRVRAPEGLEYTYINGELSLVAQDTSGFLDLIVLDTDIHGLYEINGRNQVFRQLAKYDPSEYPGPGYHKIGTLHFSYAGTFDPDKLSIAPMDSPIAAPLEIYRLSPERVLKGLGGKNVPTGTNTKSLHPFDFVGAPVGGLIPIEGVNIPDIGIDSIRVKVSGVEEMNESSQVRIAYIAQQIRDLTGLHVDIVLGSSQQRKPVNLYGYDNANRQEYIANIKSGLAATVAELEKKTGMPVKLDFITMETDILYHWLNSDIPLIYLPLTFPEEKKPELQTLTDSSLQGPLAELGYPEYDVQFFNWHREITILMPEYKFAQDEPRNLYGVVEQYWIKLGTQVRIYQETNRGTFWITLGLMAVGALFIGNTTYISAVGRTGEFSALRSLGWRRSTVFRVFVTETLLISILAGTFTAGILALVWLLNDRYMESRVLLMAVPAVVLIFLVGSLPPLLRTIHISPLQGARQGEFRPDCNIGGSRPLGFIIRGLLSRPGRTAVTTLAMIIPAGILAFIIFIYFGIQAVLGETLLGEYLAVELQGYHFVLNALVFAVAGLAVTDTLLINLRDRQKEFALLKAVGWRSTTIAGLLLGEGTGLGLVGGIIGTGLAAGIFISIFGLMPPNPWLFTTALALAPALVGGLAAVAPALRAAKIPAAQVIRAD